MSGTSLRPLRLRSLGLTATTAAALVTAVLTAPAPPTTIPPAAPTALGPAAPAAPALGANALFPPPTPAPAARPAAPATAQPSPPLVRLVAHPPAAAPTRTSAGSSAMRRALSKVGAPYRWGAAGPRAFDCSGLVSWAYRGSGVALPRSSRAMSKVGTPVARANLRPGDLVFFYKPVSHVGIYIGNGKIVHASSKKYPVKISDMSRMKFNSARRV